MTASPCSAEGAVTDQVVREAVAQASVTGCRVFEAIEAMTGLSARQVVRQVADRLGIEAMETTSMDRCTPLFELLPLALALERSCVLLRDETGRILAITPDPFDLDLTVWLEARAGRYARMAAALPADILAYLSRQEEAARAMQSILPSAGTDEVASSALIELTYSGATQEASAAVRVLNSTLYDALKSGASDIHLEATADGLLVRYRIDGMLDDVATVRGSELGEQVVSRLKVLADLDIAERRVPQDGSFRVSAGGREIDLRVSVMPSAQGEDAVVRILDKRRIVEATGQLTLDALGFDGSSRATLRDLLSQPYGMLLVTGPTGSGKTTTLYAALAEINSGKDKIVTIEDPVEYQIPRVLQIPVNEKKGLTFARGLRSILRHDPDKIMVGEIRDRETAEIAVQAALTGHLVLTTVHANNVFDVFRRLAHMSIDPFAFASALIGIWAQRLVRLVCRRCGQWADADGCERVALQRQAGESDPIRVFKGTGCGDCRGTGYRGRRAIAEILRLDEDIRDMIVERQPARLIRERARLGGTRLLREACVDLVMRGETTVEELNRVTLHA
jgi:general secretion pathway protein E